MNTIVPDREDFLMSSKSRKNKLKPYEVMLKKFQYKKALNEAINSKNPEVVMSLLEEIIERDALELAVANRTPEELKLLMEFMLW
eukprot:CAMPEP_0116879450 /NCGR_PEP_ID=MMETSP0463-20121206/11268_1 /TAXON_ID=181622 /ORGANISM="Strombidinopsis sp, Strain SopsisLIS2011" /LENGTH=84 /DNA_ID=CAMNT_0004528819 /DNA_START=1150 /DNA_END=1401 /DNA_ORIENTATION=-